MSAWVIAARRTPVAPRHGAFARLEAAELAAPVIQALCAEAGDAGVDQVILGNALYGGGNPARVAALLAGLPETVPAMTIDTQCCGGLDAVLLAAALVSAGQARAVIAGGLESYSRAPIRQRRPRDPAEAPQSYARPPFTPWPERDPDMIEAAAGLAALRGVPRCGQEDYAIASHRRALGARHPELVPLAGLERDAFARPLTRRLCARLPVLAGDAAHGVTAATVAVEADAAAAVLVVDEALARRHPGRALRLLGGVRGAGDPVHPALAPIAAARALLARCEVAAERIAVSEIMEAFAVQAMACRDGIGLDPARCNRGGGALARGHPIGASGAILAVRLFHELQADAPGAVGLAAIAAAGGLGSALLLSA
ncbi:putative acetyl-CoA C-acetyltransferase YhfS [Rhodovastum atsumiense]|uniref:Acetyl-CoA C-acyltransferase n=1 Tax=Rhodovastum atsumiense TaxID=504468 RepID=A0A5M6IM83_9PROT|nr:acetyl-CoA C-acyltransferase [Rhodovastum atsumiense]KAA5608959.1 acetyl-CoA C-acyltransferase [Rhodovastum atsumiense]CAH2603696.1 putative acetyl-CoA C-acetyltransferase YhfS [Rhodovastum atsumiense]